MLSVKSVKAPALVEMGLIADSFKEARHKGLMFQFL